MHLWQSFKKNFLKNPNFFENPLLEKILDPHLITANLSGSI